MIRFLTLGGGGEIGANSYYLNISGTGIILDCGMHPQKTGLEALPNFDLIKNEPVDYLLISHAHQDHLSSLPFLVKEHPYLRIISTPQTRALSELTLHNSAAILKDQLKENELIEVYSHDEIDLLIQTIQYKAYKEEFILNGYQHKSSDPINALFYDAGHILGSAGILIEHKGEKIFYTGDINLDKQALISGAELPEEKVNTLIIESTYGAADSSELLNWEDESLRFTHEANKIINSGGSILIPLFALGKMQEMLTTIWNLMLQKRLTKVDIYTGGLGRKISRVYDYNRYVVNMLNPEFELNKIPQKSFYEINKIDDFFKEPCIVLASSGMMLPPTASYKLALTWIKQSNAAIFTVGYMDESTPGYKFANAIKGGEIKLNDYGKEEQVKCTIKNFRFSAHAKREGLIEIVKRLKPENVILVHGDPPAIDWMGAAIIKEYKNIKVYKAEIGKEIILQQ